MSEAQLVCVSTQKEVSSPLFVLLQREKRRISVSQNNCLLRRGMQALLAAEANVNATAGDGSTALTIASQGGTWRWYKFLIRRRVGRRRGVWWPRWSSTAGSCSRTSDSS